MTLTIFFKASDGVGLELASYTACSDTIIAHWLVVGKSKVHSSFYLVLLDDSGECLDAKYLSKKSFSRLLSEWDCFGLKGSDG